MRFKTINLEAVTDVKTGFPLRKAAKEDFSGDAVLVQMKDVDPLAGVNWSDAIKINTKGSRNPDWLKEDDVLFVGRGSRFFAVHVSSVKKHSVASPHFYVLRNKKAEKILPEFLVWFLNSTPAHKFYTSNQEGSALPYLSRKTLAALPIKLPDLETQKKIINISKCWNHQRQLLEELTEQKDAYINALLEQTLEGEAA
ncbi:MAG: hypothetical protein CBB87_06030 [Micavibrio sp. TMED27]|nr:hypothetical protein [Micavibrio sp.]OUT91571.1 MAG: hypothetical protein CBB87_06030 [Micavibrio sp. TMED27]|tara:strand:+ start:448 stop:1041 length:594 start_codon:yes stop_codon:yes gene_type:complete